MNFFGTLLESLKLPRELHRRCAKILRTNWKSIVIAKRIVLPRRRFNHGVPAVILAAGQGTRLRNGNGGNLKPLTKIGSLTLLERDVGSCEEAGVEECLVVCGYGADRLVPHVREIDMRSKLSVRAILNPNWMEGNGTSVLAAQPYVSTPFLLLMCDHICDPEILRSLLSIDPSPATLLAIDRRIDEVFDLPDATKVQCNSNKILKIGKELGYFNAIDTGFFLCRHSLFDALRIARTQGDTSLSGGIRELSRVGKMKAMDIGVRCWLDVDTPESLVYAESLILSGLCPSFRNELVMKGA